MSIKIEVKHKQVYGNDNIYVCDPKLADVISRLTGKRTVSKSDLLCLQALGCEVIDLDQVLHAMFN